jgi:uncharacterized membrane protein (DUF106 family)
MVGSIVIGICTGIMVVMVNEAYRRNLKMEIDEVKEEIYEVKEEIFEARLDLKKDHRWLLEEVENVYEKNKELMELLKREVEGSNEEE